MSKLFSKVRKDDKEKQPAAEEGEENNKQQLQLIQQNFDSISAQMDALQLQDYQNMALDQFERLVIVGMHFDVICIISIYIILYWCMYANHDTVYYTMKL
jgi:hypothetical protein